MKKLLSLGVVAVLLVSACAAYAVPTVFGPTGGFQVPTTDIAEGVQLSVDRFEGESTQYPNSRVLVGVMEDLEVGAYYKQDQNTRAWNVNAKYALPFFTEYADLAVGAVYGEQFGQGAHVLAGYLSAGKEFFGLQTTAAVAYTELVETNDNQWVYALAAEKAFENDTKLGAEFVGGFAADFGNIYFLTPLNENLTGRVALSGIGQATDISFGATYAFGN